MNKLDFHSFMYIFYSKHLRSKELPQVKTIEGPLKNYHLVYKLQILKMDRII